MPLHLDRSSTHHLLLPLLPGLISDIYIEDALFISGAVAICFLDFFWGSFTFLPEVSLPLQRNLTVSFCREWEIYPLWIQFTGDRLMVNYPTWTRCQYRAFVGVTQNIGSSIRYCQLYFSFLRVFEA